VGLPNLNLEERVGNPLIPLFTLLHDIDSLIAIFKVFFFSNPPDALGTGTGIFLWFNFAQARVSGEPAVFTRQFDFQRVSFPPSTQKVSPSSNRL